MIDWHGCKYCLRLSLVNVVIMCHIAGTRRSNEAIITFNAKNTLRPWTFTTGKLAVVGHRDASPGLRFVSSECFDAV